MNRFKWFIAGLLLAMTTGVMALNVNGELKVALLELLASDPVSQVEEGRIYYNTASKQAKIYNGSNWTGLGSGGGSGEINYIDNFDFENGTVDGWVTYDDGAVAIPVDGVGGSPTAVSILPCGAGQIRGSDCLSIDKPLGDGQGEGVAYDFQIEDPDKNKMLKIQFPFFTTSGTDNDEWVVYIYDKDNANLITPSFVDLGASDNPIDRPAATWVSTDADDYRLIIHRASSDTAAKTVTVDNVIVGPGSVVTGAGIGDVQFSPTINGFGSTTNEKWDAQQAGEYLVVSGFFRAGTPAASTASFDLPSGLTINPAKVTSTSNGHDVGRYTRIISGAATDIYGSTPLSGVMFVEASTDTDTVFFAKQTGSNVLTQINGSDVVNSSDYIVVNFRIPIAEWAGSGSVNLGAGHVDYASSTTGTWDAAATATDTVYGPSGSPISGALTADRDKVVRFLTPTQPTDKFVLELDETGNGYWVPFESRVVSAYWPSANFGYRIIPSNSTDVTVRFFQYATPGTTYNSTTGAVPWNTHLGTSGKWRLVRHSAGVPVGFDMAADGKAGLVSSSTQTISGDKTINGALVADSFNGYKFTSASTPVASDCSASPCTIEYSYGGGITTITRSGTGIYNVQFAASFFTGNPICFCTSSRGGDTFCSINGAASTSVDIQFLNSGALGDGRFNIVCMGAP